MVARWCNHAPQASAVFFIKRALMRLYQHRIIPFRFCEWLAARLRRCRAFREG